MADKAQPTDAAAPSPAVTDETQPAPPTTPPRRSPGHRGQDMRDTVAEMAAKAHEISLEAGSKMAGAMKDVINAAAGLAGFAVESARDLVQYMVRRGQMTQDEADKLIREAEEAYNKRHPQARGGAAAAASAESNGATRTRETKSAAPHVATHGAVHAAPAAPAVKKAAEPARPAATKAAEPARPAATKAAAPTKAAAKPATKSAAKAPAKAATKAPATKSAAKAPAAKGGAKSASKTAAKKAPAKKK